VGSARGPSPARLLVAIDGRARILLERVLCPPDPLPGQVELDLGQFEKAEHPLAFFARHLGGDGIADIGLAIRIVVVGK
jgi:hypothetical protein